MFIWLYEWLMQDVPILHVFYPLIMRNVMAGLTALVLSLWMGPYLIRYLSAKQTGQPIRHDGPQSHLSKAGTPTMGGILILMTMMVAILLWGELKNPYLWLLISVTAGIGLIGWIDDYKKLIKKNSKGLAGRWKYFFQSLIAILTLMGLWIISKGTPNTLSIPFTSFVLSLGSMYYLLAYFVIVGTSNAVNLTDGLDGLAIVPVALVATGLGFIAYFSGSPFWASHWSLTHLSYSGELSLFCSALVGSSLGFLWFNAYPAKLFMGDVGALALGAALGTLGVMIHQELILFIMGGLFVIETLSVILQVYSFKLTGKRLFLMSPIHHHFELKGWPENRVIVRFWIMTLLCVVIGFLSLHFK